MRHMRLLEKGVGGKNSVLIIFRYFSCLGSHVVLPFIHISTPKYMFIRATT